MARGAGAALMCQNSLQVIVTAIIGAKICVARKNSLNHLIIHHVLHKCSQQSAHIHTVRK